MFWEKNVMLSKYRIQKYSFFGEVSLLINGKKVYYILLYI